MTEKKSVDDLRARDKGYGYSRESSSRIDVSNDPRTDPNHPAYDPYAVKPANLDTLGPR